MAIDQPAYCPVTQPLGSRVHRQHPAGFQWCLGASVREDHVLARRHLLAVVVTDRPRHQQRLSHRDAAVEEGLSWPDALERATGVAEDRAENAKTLPGGRHRLGDDDAGARDFIAYPRAGERGDAGSIDVAVRNVAEEIAGGVHTQPGEGVSSAFADALEELDRSIQPERRHGPASLRRRRGVVRRSGRRRRVPGRRATRRCPRSEWEGPVRCGAPLPHPRGRCRRAW